MARMNIDLEKLGEIGQEDLDDKQTRKRLYQYLYQLSEQLKYWQYHVEEENLSAALVEKIEETVKEMVTKTTSVTDDGIRVTDKDGEESFSVSQAGDVIAGTVTTGSLTVGGQDLGTVIGNILAGRIIVSETQPEGRNVIWLEPQTQGSGTAPAVSYTRQGTGTNTYINAASNTAQLTFIRDGDEAARGTDVDYGIRIRIRSLTACYLNSVTVTLTGEDVNGDPQTITILNDTEAKYIGAGDYLSIDTTGTPAEDLTNITYGNSITAEAVLVFGGTAKARWICGETFTLECTGETASGTEEVRTCAVHYIG